MSRADISRIGQLDIITGQIQVTTQGNGEINRVQVPPSKPPNNRFFIVESAALFIEDDNAGLKITTPFPANFGLGASALGFIVANSQPQAPNALFSNNPPTWGFASLGPAVLFQLIASAAGSGVALSIFALISTRKIFVPAGYVFGLYLVDPGDHIVHQVSATLTVQGRWFTLDDCE